MRRGVTILSGIIFLALTISATVIVYEAGVPIVKRMQSAAIVENMKDTFTELDKIIRQVASEGQGSQRTVYLSIDTGRITVNETEDTIYWEFDTDAFIISPRTSQEFGNIVIGSNMKTQAYEGNYTLTSPEIPCYILENDHLRVYIRKVGSPGSHEAYSTNQLGVAVYQKHTGTWLNNTGFLEILLDNNETSGTGNGYTVLDKSGNHLPYATVTAYMDSSYADYWINLTLESGADFLEIGAYL